ncbi:MAG: hypothetical protein M3P70_14835 [Actinomycetota bacterium]|nr:hypothetical protein [Actinomycetota bacterium]
MASIHRKACEVAEREGWTQPGYKLVWSIVRHLDPALLTLARETFLYLEGASRDVSDGLV